MSGSQPSAGQSTGTNAGSGSDPSMDDILASIRRILNEDETSATVTERPATAVSSGGQGEGVLVLDPSMMVTEPLTSTEPEPTSKAPVERMSAADLVAPEAVAAAAVSIGSLVRTLTAERSMQVRAGGPTIEDIVREEIRPLLKAWLDANLPALVERLVRAEIERVVGRGTP